MHGTLNAEAFLHIKGGDPEASGPGGGLREPQSGTAHPPFHHQDSSRFISKVKGVNLSVPGSEVHRALLGEVKWVYSLKTCLFQSLKFTCPSEPLTLHPLGNDLDIATSFSCLIYMFR